MTVTAAPSELDLRAGDERPAGPRLAEAEVRSVAREGGWAGIFNLLGAAIRYGNNLILTRILGAEAYGLFGLANTVVTFTSVAAGLGLPVSCLHFVATNAGIGEWGRLRWVIRATLKVALFSSLGATLLIVILAPWASVHLFHKGVLALPLTGLALSLPFLVLYGVCAGALQGLKHIREKVFIERIAHPLVWTGLLVAGAYYFRSLPYILACFFAAAAAVLGLSALWLRRRLKEIPEASPGAPAWRELRSFSTPVLFMNLLQQFLLQSDVLVMGLCKRPAAEIGIYLIASRLGQAPTLLTDALGASLAPNVSSLMSQGDAAGLKKLFHTSTRWIFLLGTSAGLGLILAGPSLLRLFGKDFTGGLTVLGLIVFGQAFSAAFGANGTLITYTGHPKVNLANSLCLGLGNLGLCLMLVPRFGGRGAAAAAALSFVVVNIVRATEIALILKMGPWNRTIRKPMVAFAVSAVAGAAAYYWVHPLAGAAVGLGLYLLLWKLLGPEPEDWDMARRALSKFRRGAS